MRRRWSSRPRISALAATRGPVVLSASCTYSKNAELVSLRIGENDPRPLALSNVDSNSAQREQTIDFIIPIVGAEVEVQPVLYRLCLRNPNEQKSGKLVRGRPDLHYVGRFANDHPFKCPLPPASQQHRIAGVNIRLLPFESHKLDVTTTAQPSTDVNNVQKPLIRVIVRTLASSGAIASPK